ncbi:helix-turn-helix transcriptional regulator (plasmid) [Streptomyces sp. NBC_01485]|uniref:helix-turn-helix domain-containing protein n=1 Tax=Streptomyces sp. NBC_01485 TaxID=2903884 RepID=UPI002E302A0D|nr:helix-turn-helix transcriptional regulator [Streptomyces sp. NBC_01485]
MSSTEAYLRVTVTALMYATGETQADLGRGLGLSQGQVSRKQGGGPKGSSWTLGDLDKLSRHYGIPVPELLRGADHAVRLLPAVRRAAVVSGIQTTISPR